MSVLGAARLRELLRFLDELRRRLALSTLLSSLTPIVLVEAAAAYKGYSAAAAS